MIGDGKGELQSTPKGGIGKDRVHLLLAPLRSILASLVPSAASKSLFCRRGFPCSSEVRRTFLKERCERFLRFGRSYAR